MLKTKRLKHSSIERVACAKIGGKYLGDDALFLPRRAKLEIQKQGCCVQSFSLVHRVWLAASKTLSQKINKKKLDRRFLVIDFEGVNAELLP